MFAAMSATALSAPLDDSSAAGVDWVRHACAVRELLPLTALCFDSGSGQQWYLYFRFPRLAGLALIALELGRAPRAKPISQNASTSFHKSIVSSICVRERAKKPRLAM